jgi:hypothetical protein
MGSKFTKTDLLQLTDYVEFESFCHNLLAMEGYAHIEPLGGGKDKGRDAVHVERSSGKVTIFAYSVREDWEDKLDEDLGKIQKHGHPCDEVVFLTNGSPTAGEKDKKKKAVKEKYGWGLEFYDLERISTLVDGRHPELRALPPQIFIISSKFVAVEPTGGELDRKAYAAYLLASYAEWRERYTPLLAEYREVDAFVTPAGSGGAGGADIPVARVHERAGVAVLLGESGAGKTTALWKIVVEACEAIASETSSLTPVLISMRGWTKTHACRELVQEQFDVLGVSREAVERELVAGNCLVLVDGLNEIRPDEDFRTDAYQELQAFISRYPSNRFVVCCRAADYEPRMLDRERLAGAARRPELFEIRRMDRGQVIDYVRRYFKDAPAGGERLLEMLKVRDEDMWKDTAAAVHLARIPLYLQLFISEFKRSGELPSNQAKLLRALIDMKMSLEKAKQAGRVENFAKERLLSSLAFRSVSSGSWLRVHELVAMENLRAGVQEAKEQGLIGSEMTVGAVLQEVLSNNFLTARTRPWLEWLHQLILDYFLAVEIVRVWTIGELAEKGQLRKRLTRRTWAQACAIALGLLDEVRGARFLEHLIQLDAELARAAFEAQTEVDRRAIVEVLVTEVLDEGDPESDRLDALAEALPSETVVATLDDKLRVCDAGMDAVIARALCSMMVKHYSSIVPQAAPSWPFESAPDGVSGAVRRATDLLRAWTNSRNELVRFFAAKGLWGAERDLAARTLRQLKETGGADVVRRVDELMGDWNIE